MDKKLIKFIHQLKGKTYPETAINGIYQDADNVFLILHKKIINGEFTCNQIQHSLTIMFDLIRQHCPSRRKVYYILLLSMTNTENLSIRSCATLLLIRMVLVSKEFKNYLDINLLEAIKIIQNSIELGLNKKVKDYALWFLKENIE